jgi:dATP pyrophosphohydrolase
MSRAPFQILVIPYRLTPAGDFEFALLRRSDQKYWQGIAGGGEGNETPMEAARRETNEEAGIPPESEFMQLESTSYVPIYHFPELSDSGLLVIPEYAFGVNASDVTCSLSHEHTELQWFSYEEATGKVLWDSNKTALWELQQRLRAQR